MHKLYSESVNIIIYSSDNKSQFTVHWGGGGGGGGGIGPPGGSGLGTVLEQQVARDISWGGALVTNLAEEERCLEKVVEEEEDRQMVQEEGACLVCNM